MKEQQSELEWSMSEIADTLTNRRYLEACIAYVECHD